MYSGTHTYASKYFIHFGVIVKYRYMFNTSETLKLILRDYAHCSYAFLIKDYHQSAIEKCIVLANI